ncbi:C39 family peptidase [Myxococcota bacterium]|nr:C39 family peptidase [Myxococcota bacterium]
MHRLPTLLLSLWACTPAPGPASPRAGDPGGGDGDGGAGDGGAGDGGAGDGGAGDGGAGDGGTAGAPWVRLLSPADGATVENPVRFEVEGEGVDQLTLTADGWDVATWSPALDGWSVEYSFSGTGYPRSLLLEGLDGTGAVVATDQATITVQDPGVHLDVPYYDQYDNRYEPSATCGITSAAMLLGWWDAGAPTPDELYVTYGKSQGQSPSGLAQLYQWEGLQARYTTTGSRDEIRAHLDAGRPVVVHGWWTSAGHITVIVGYDDSDWIVNDPAGDWEVCYGCGGGEGVRYAIGGAWDQELSLDGDLWYSVADPAGF